MLKKILLMFLLFLPTTFSFAETIKLKSGTVREGKIIEKTDKYIKLDMGLDVPITYYLDEIENIYGNEILPKQEAMPAAYQAEISQPKLVPEINQNTYVNEKFGISITGPKGWYMLADKEWDSASQSPVDYFKTLGKIIGVEDIDSAFTTDYEKECKVRFSKYPLSTDFNTELNNPVITFDLTSQPEISAETSSLEYLEKISIPLLRKIGQIIFVEEPHEVVLNSKKGARVIYKDGKGQSLVFVILEKSFLYTFAADCRAKDFANNFPLFEEALNSLKINGGLNAR